ncbi:MAG: transposase [Chloracidobacterium sp.]|nr:transposase [Chloracidobacterium sp.]
MSAKDEWTCYHPSMPDPKKSLRRRKYTRGYLPHFDDHESIQFITFRLADSMPRTLLNAWKQELLRGAITDAGLRKRIEQYLDKGRGSCYLRDRRIARMIIETLMKWDGDRYELIAWVIMPNHVHLLIRLLGKNVLAEIMHSIKSYTAHEANRILVRSGRFWAVESFDRYIRNSDHFRNTIQYIEHNPVKAGLCSRPEDWEFGSAFPNDPA